MPSPGSKVRHHVTPTVKQTVRSLETMQKQALQYINEVTYPSLCVLGKGKVPLMVWCTCHHQTPLPASGVCLRPLRGAPLVHHPPLALAFTGHPIWRHLHVNKHLSYKKITVSVLNLRKKQYLLACIALWSAYKTSTQSNRYCKTTVQKVWGQNQKKICLPSVRC